MCTHDIDVKKIVLLIFMNEALSNLKQCRYFLNLHTQNRCEFFAQLNFIHYYYLVNVGYLQ